MFECAVTEHACSPAELLLFLLKEQGMIFLFIPVQVSAEGCHMRSDGAFLFYRNKNNQMLLVHFTPLTDFVGSDHLTHFHITQIQPE